MSVERDKYAEARDAMNDLYDRAWKARLKMDYLYSLIDIEAEEAEYEASR